MDSLEAASKLLARINTIDPQNAQRIVGFLLMQGHYTEELLSLAQGPQNHIVNIVNQVKLHLGLLQMQRSPLLLHENNQNMHQRNLSHHSVLFDSGFCKNGDHCMFLHAANSGDHQQQQLQQQQQQQRMVVPYIDYVNYGIQQQQLLQGGSVSQREIYKFPKPEAMRLAAKTRSSSSALRQIYLTFPAESSFKDEDVAKYFGDFGPVQDVRIPYQQRRMFGFVTFVFKETAEQVLLMGNPHYISDCRVLVKPYKEKPKVVRRQEHQQLEGWNSACLSPSGVNPQGYYELQLSPQTRTEMHNAQETILRELQEQADYQNALELQERFANLRLAELENDRIYRHQRSTYLGSPLALPNPVECSQRTYADSSSLQAIQENHDAPSAASFASSADAESHLLQTVNMARIRVDYADQCKNQKAKEDTFEAFNEESNIELNLPDNLFASPTKSAWDEGSFFSTFAETATGSALPASSSSENYLLPSSSAAVDAASL